MGLLLQIAQLVTSVALVATLWWVIKYTKATRAMAGATRAMADTQREEIELRKRPVVRILVAEPEKISMNGNLVNYGQPFRFRTHIDNISNVHAKVRMRASVVFAGKELKVPKDSLYNGMRTLEIQAGTGVNGHLDFDNLFQENGIPLDKISEQLGDTIERQLRVKLETWVVYYYDSDDKLYSQFSKNPPAHYYWKGQYNIDARGSWVPDYDVRDFEA